MLSYSKFILLYLNFAYFMNKSEENDRKEEIFSQRISQSGQLTENENPQQSKEKTVDDSSIDEPFQYQHADDLRQHESVKSDNKQNKVEELELKPVQETESDGVLYKKPLKEKRTVNFGEDQKFEFVKDEMPVFSSFSEICDCEEIYIHENSYDFRNENYRAVEALLCALSACPYFISKLQVDFLQKMLEFGTEDSKKNSEDDLSDNSKNYSTTWRKLGSFLRYSFKFSYVEQKPSTPNFEDYLNYKIMEFTENFIQLFERSRKHHSFDRLGTNSDTTNLRELIEKMGSRLEQISKFYECRNFNCECSKHRPDKLEKRQSRSIFSSLFTQETLSNRKSQSVARLLDPILYFLMAEIEKEVNVSPSCFFSMEKRNICGWCKNIKSKSGTKNFRMSSRLTDRQHVKKNKEHLFYDETLPECRCKIPSVSKKWVMLDIPKTYIIVKPKNLPDPKRI